MIPGTVSSYSHGAASTGDIVRIDMGCEIVDQRDGQITFRISGQLKRAELTKAERSAAEVMRSGAKLRMLLLVQDFQGWDDEGDWGNLAFQAKHDGQIEKIAIVGEERWRELAEAFAGKGRRSVDIRYFTPSQAAVARVWITQTGRGARHMRQQKECE